MHKNVDNVIRDIFLILLGILVFHDPSMTEIKSGYGYPYNMLTGIIYMSAFGILLIYDLRKLRKD